MQNNYDDLNFASGSYPNQAQRFTMNQTNSIYQVILKNFTNQINNEILNTNHNFRVSLTFDTITNLIDVNSLLGIPNMNINSISLLIKMQKLNQLTINYKLNQLN